jgi:hypothetical protein
MVVGFTTTCAISYLTPFSTIFQLYLGGLFCLVDDTGVPTENHRPVASHWQTLSHNVVSSIPRQARGIVESGVKYHKPNQTKLINNCSKCRISFLLNYIVEGYSINVIRTQWDRYIRFHYKSRGSCSVDSRLEAKISMYMIKLPLTAFLNSILSRFELILVFSSFSILSISSIRYIIFCVEHYSIRVSIWRQKMKSL